MLDTKYWYIICYVVLYYNIFYWLSRNNIIYILYLCRFDPAWAAVPASAVWRCRRRCWHRVERGEFTSRHQDRCRQRVRVILSCLRESAQERHRYRATAWTPQWERPGHVSPQQTIYHYILSMLSPCYLCITGLTVMIAKILLAAWLGYWSKTF